MLVNAAELKYVSDLEKDKKIGPTVTLHKPALCPCPSSPSTVCRPRSVARKQFDL